LSSIPAIVKRKPVGIANVGKVLVLITVCFAQPTLAQSDPSAAAEQTDSDDTELETIASRSTDQEDGNLVIDILDRAENRYGPPTPVEDCSVEQEAAIISGEIIVCRRKRDQRRFRTLDPDARWPDTPMKQHFATTLAPPISSQIAMIRVGQLAACALAKCQSLR